VIATGKPGFELGGFASNGYAENSPGGYSLEACLVAELVLTFRMATPVEPPPGRRPDGVQPRATPWVAAPTTRRLKACEFSHPCRVDWGVGGGQGVALG